MSTVVRLLLLTALLSGCGWGLRGTHETPGANLGQIYLTGDTQILHEVRQAMRNSDAVVTNKRSDADYIIWVGDEERERRSASYDVLVRTSEYELIMRADYKVSSGDGFVVAGPGRVFAERVYQFEVDAVTSSAAQEATIEIELRQRLAQQIVRRIAALDPADLATSASEQRAELEQAKNKGPQTSSESAPSEDSR